MELFSRDPIEGVADLGEGHGDGPRARLFGIPEELDEEQAVDHVLWRPGEASAAADLGQQALLHVVGDGAPVEAGGLDDLVDGEESTFAHVSRVDS